jgi:hypothetical protein
MWEVVLELCKLDLQLALRAARMLGKDVEDELRAIDDARLERVLERALLGRGDLLVHEQHVRCRRSVLGLQLLELALADERPAVGPVPVLDELRHGHDARGPCELPQLRELLLGVDALREHAEDEPTLRLRPRSGIGLARRHGRIIAAVVCRDEPARRAPRCAHARARRYSLGKRP